MMTLHQVHTELLSAAQGTPVVSEMPPPPPPFLQGYVAALEDVKMFLDLSGVWWQRLVPAAMIPGAAVLRERFCQRYGAALHGWSDG
jgi:hypothetical protein